MTNQYRCPYCLQTFDWNSSEDTITACPVCLENLSEPVLTYKSGTVIGDYQIIKHIGLGGMGEIFLAKQLSMDRDVALKILHSALVKDKAYLERFFREVRTLAAIEHPNVIQAIEAGVDDGRCYFSMMYIDGYDIASKLDKDEVFEESEALRIIHDTAGALEYVWEKHKTLHRDIKPANIMLTYEDNILKLMDLGISKKLSADPEPSLTVEGMMVGSPAYVSPEQARAEKDIDFRVDIYSLGATYYHMLTGEPPYDNDSSMGIIAKHLTEPIPDIRKTNKKLSIMSKKLIDKMMAKNREKRFSSWQELIEEIKKIHSKINKDEEKNLTDFSQTEIEPETESSEKIPEKKKKNQEKVPFLERKINKKRFVSLVILLILFLMAFYSMVNKALKEEKARKIKIRYTRAENYLSKAQTIIENDLKRKNFARIKSLLEKAAEFNAGSISNRAESLLKELPDKLNRYELNTHRERYRNCKKKSDQLILDKKYDKAINIWERFLNLSGISADLKNKARKEIRSIENEKQKYGENIKGLE